MSANDPSVLVSSMEQAAQPASSYPIEFSDGLKSDYQIRVGRDLGTPGLLSSARLVEVTDAAGNSYLLAGKTSTSNKDADEGNALEQEVVTKINVTAIPGYNEMTIGQRLDALSISTTTCLGAMGKLALPNGKPMYLYELVKGEEPVLGDDSEIVKPAYQKEMLAKLIEIAKSFDEAEKAGFDVTDSTPPSKLDRYHFDTDGRLKVLDWNIVETIEATGGEVGRVNLTHTFFDMLTGSVPPVIMQRRGEKDFPIGTHPESEIRGLRNFDNLPGPVRGLLLTLGRGTGSSSAYPPREAIKFAHKAIEILDDLYGDKPDFAPANLYQYYDHPNNAATQQGNSSAMQRELLRDIEDERLKLVIPTRFVEDFRYVVSARTAKENDLILRPFRGICSNLNDGVISGAQEQLEEWKRLNLEQASVEGTNAYKFMRSSIDFASFVRSKEVSHLVIDSVLVDLFQVAKLLPPAGQRQVDLKVLLAQTSEKWDEFKKSKLPTGAVDAVVNRTNLQILAGKEEFSEGESVIDFLINGLKMGQDYEGKEYTSDNQTDPIEGLRASRFDIERYAEVAQVMERFGLVSNPVSKYLSLMVSDIENHLKQPEAASMLLQSLETQDIALLTQMGKNLKAVGVDQRVIKPLSVSFGLFAKTVGGEVAQLVEDAKSASQSGGDNSIAIAERIASAKLKINRVLSLSEAIPGVVNKEDFEALKPLISVVEGGLSESGLSKDLAEALGYEPGNQHSVGNLVNDVRHLKANYAEALGFLTNSGPMLKVLSELGIKDENALRAALSISGNSVEGQANVAELKEVEIDSSAILKRESDLKLSEDAIQVQREQLTQQERDLAERTNNLAARESIIKEREAALVDRAQDLRNAEEALASRQRSIEIQEKRIAEEQTLLDQEKAPLVQKGTAVVSPEIAPKVSIISILGSERVAETLGKNLLGENARYYADFVASVRAHNFEHAKPSELYVALVKNLITHSPYVQRDQVSEVEIEDSLLRILSDGKLNGSKLIQLKRELSSLAPAYVEERSRLLSELDKIAEIGDQNSTF